MTMIITAKNDPHTIIMTADKRETYSNILGEITGFSDNYKKTLVIEGNFVLSFAGRTYIVESALKYINEHIIELRTIQPGKQKEFFQGAFQFGKTSFIREFPSLKPTTVFYLGYINNGIASLLAFSSDDNYEGKEIDAAIKVNAKNEVEEDTVRQETELFIANAINKKNGTLSSYRELANIYFEAIKQVDDPQIGKTGTTLVLTPTGIEEYEHN